MNIKRFIKYGVFLLTVISSSALCAEEVGRIQYTHGAVSIQNVEGNSTRLVAKNETFQRGDVLMTGPRSLTIIALNDGTRMTIRPGSVFSVTRFNSNKNSTAKMEIQLDRGGIRVLSGYISKRNPNAFKVITGAVKLTVHGADFDMRLCQDDCEEENKKHQKVHENTVADEAVPPGYYISINRGSIDITGKAGTSLSLKTGQSGYIDVLGRRTKQLPTKLAFQQFDVYPLPDVVTPKVINFSADALAGEIPGVVCEIK